MPDNTSHQVNLLDFIAFIGRWRVFLLATVMAVVVVVGVVSLVTPPRYRSIAVIRASEGTSTSVGSLLASQFAGLGSAGSLLPVFGDVPEQIFVSVLKSRWMGERVIDKFRLREVYRMRRASIEEILAKLESRTQFELDPDTRTLRVIVDDTDPSRARDMAAFYVDELDARNQSLKSTNARREREFIGQRLQEEQSLLSSMEDSLSRFQLATGVLNPEEQAKATIQAGALLEAQRLAVQIELEMSATIRGPRAPETELLRIRLASIDSSSRSLIKSRGPGTDTELLIRLQDLPEQGMTFLRLMRDIEVHQLLTAFLVQQHEQARIEEQRNTPTLMRVDPPVAATKRVWPRRGLMVVIAGVGALVMAIVVAAVAESFRRAARDSASPHHQKMIDIRQSWSRK